MATYGLTPGTDALRAALSLMPGITDDTAAQVRAVALANRLKAAGFTIVPIEPTRAMWAAGGDAVVNLGHVHHDKITEAAWAAMVAAATTS